MQVDLIRRHISSLVLHWDHLIFLAWVETVAVPCPAATQISGAEALGAGSAHGSNLHR